MLENPPVDEHSLVDLYAQNIVKLDFGWVACVLRMLQCCPKGIDSEEGSSSNVPNLVYVFSFVNWGGTPPHPTPRQN